MEGESSQPTIEGEQQITEIIADATKQPGVGSQVVVRLVLAFFKGT